MKLKLAFRLLVIMALDIVLMQSTIVAAHAWWLVWNGGW
jgi:hypothetical protein